jgi:hypothetical protein
MRAAIQRVGTVTPGSSVLTTSCPSLTNFELIDVDLLRRHGIHEQGARPGTDTARQPGLKKHTPILKGNHGKFVHWWSKKSCAPTDA